jgi:hypothetical protein
MSNHYLLEKLIDVLPSILSEDNVFFIALIGMSGVVLLSLICGIATTDIVETVYAPATCPEVTLCEKP